MAKKILPALAFALFATVALAQSGAPLKVKNLAYARVGEFVKIEAKEAPAGIKNGDKFNLVDASNNKITGTGTVDGTTRKGGNTGEITAWNIKVDSVKK